MISSHRLSRPLLALILLIFATPHVGHAQVGQWINWGPDGGRVRLSAIDASDSSSLYLGTHTHLFHWADERQRWEWTSRNLPWLLRGIWTAPGQPSTVFVSTSKGLYSSNNQGRAWRRIFDLETVHQLTVSPQAPRRLTVQTQNGLYRSENRGRDWQPIGQTLGDLQLFDLAIDPIDPERYYVLASETGQGAPNLANSLRMSADGGETWSTIFASSGLRAMAVGPPPVDGEPTVLYLFDTAHTFYRSFDGGTNWETLPDRLISGNTTVLQADPGNPGRLYVALIQGTVLRRSKDYGESWTFATDKADGNALAFDPKRRNHAYYAAGRWGLGQTRNGGRTFTARPAVPAMKIASIAPDPRSEDAIAVLAEGCPFATNDRAATWKNLSDRCPSSGGRTHLMRDPEDPDLLWSGDFRGLWRSTDNGETWELRDTMRDPPEVLQTVDDPRGPRHLWLLTDDGLFHYVDEGAVWTPILRPDERSPVTALAIAPNQPDHLSITTNRQLFRSTDGGATWRRASVRASRHEVLGGIVFDPREPERVYVMSTRRVWRSLDGGSTWEIWRQGLPRERRIDALAIDPGTGALYAGLSTTGGGRPRGGVFRRPADGGSWQQIGDLKANLVELVVERRGGRALIWAGTYGRSLFRLERQR